MCGGETAALGPRQALDRLRHSGKWRRIETLCRHLVGKFVGGLHESWECGEESGGRPVRSG